jgi:tetratricopeptide (TPR) repeat protein
MSKTKVKSLLKDISLIFICLLLFTSLAVSQDFSSLYKDASPSVVIVFAYDSKSNSVSQGSGFFINEDGDIISNYHVIKGSNKIEVMTSDGKKYPVKDILATDKDIDLFLASVDIPKNEVHPIKISSTIPEIGEDIMVIGCPEGLSQTMTRGIISAIRDLKDYGTVIQIDAAISPGSSGSPVINKEGEVIGVATFGRVEGQSLNFAISSKQVSDLIEKAGIISNDPNTWNNKGKTLYRLGEYDEAIKAFDEAIRLDPNYAKAWNNKGIVLKNQGKYDEAIKAFDEAIRLDPTIAATWNNKGSTYVRQGKYNEAIKAYDESIRLDPEDADVWKDKGNLLYSMAESPHKYGEPTELYKKALECYNKTLKANPLDAEAWTVKGFILDDLNLSDEATTSYRTAIGIDPVNSEIYWANRGINLRNDFGVLTSGGSTACAVMAMELKKNPNDTDQRRKVLKEEGSEIILAFDKAIVVDKYYSDFWNRYCEIFDDKCVCGGLVECYENSSKRELAFNAKGWVLLKMGMYNESIEYFDKALEKNPQFLEAWGNKGKALEAISRTAEANYALDKSGGNLGPVPNRVIGRTNHDFDYMMEL